MRRLFRALIAATLLLAGAGTAPAQTLYAVSGAGGAPSVLYRINPANGVVLQVVGNIGFSHVTGLAYDPTSGVLYGHVSDNHTGGVGTLITINPLTGAGTAVGDTGQQVPDMTITPSGVLYAWSENGDDLYTLNKATGASTLVGESGIGTAFTGLGFRATTNTLYVKSLRDLYSLNTTTGDATFVATLSGSSPGDLDPNNVLTFNAAGNGFSVVRSGGQSFLMSVDVDGAAMATLGEITNGGASVGQIAALAFVASVPEPAAIVMVGLAVASTAGLSLWRLRRRAVRRFARR